MTSISSFLLSIHSCLMAHGLLLPHSHYQVTPSFSYELLLAYTMFLFFLFSFSNFPYFFLPSFLSFFLPTIFLILHFLRHYFFLLIFCPTSIPLSNLFSYLTDSYYVICMHTLGMGWGLQIGAELTEVLLILSSDSAVDAFKSRAQVLTTIPSFNLYLYDQVSLIFI